MSLNRKSIKDIKLGRKRVLIRVDYNVPLGKNLEVQDDRRIVGTIPTIKHALENGARSVVLMSHLGRPAGKVVPRLSLKSVLTSLQNALKNVTAKKVTFIPSISSSEYEEAVNSPKEGGIYLLENLRYHAEEEGKGVDEKGNKITVTKQQQIKFAEQLSKLGDVYVNDAFAAAHRAHCSVVGITLSERAAGFLMEKELVYFAKALDHPKKPFLSILGGAKVSDKILLIENLFSKVDEMIIGGGMAYTFLKVLDGTAIGTSLYDEEGATIVNRIMEKAKKNGVKVHFPVDFVLADKFSPDAKVHHCTAKDGIPSDLMGLDCGEKSRDLFKKVVERAKTIVWNGPLGVFEFDAFANGTNFVLESVATATQNNADVTSIIGGGDTASAAEKLGVAGKMSHVSTGGGASLELLEGKKLPGVEHLNARS